MTVLSAQTIRSLDIISPFHERTTHKSLTFGLGPAGYDVRIAQDKKVYNGHTVLASTIEHFDMPLNVIGFVCDKSTWARRGLFVQNTVIEPGWRGYLTLELSYHWVYEWADVKEGDPIAQVIFHFLDASTCLPYNGKYQDQGQAPQEAM